ncbi:hypothetical protein B0H11DRAFT_1904141 [Mycena galericulata]|nr:hypothetical protein B0H11DRAFT_1904141 [Mycena galericulata]
MGEWRSNSSGELIFQLDPPPFNHRWTAVQRANWTKTADTLCSMDVSWLFSGPSDLLASRETRRFWAKECIRALVPTCDLQPSATSGMSQMWGSDSSMLPASAGFSERHSVTTAVTGPATLVLQMKDRAFSILHGELLGHFWMALSGPSGCEFAKFVVKSSRPSAVLDDKECKMLLNRVLPEFCYAMTTVDVDHSPKGPYEHTITADDLNNAPHLDVQFPSKAVIQKSMTPAFEKKRKHRSSSPPDDAESISTKKAGKAKAKDAPKSLVQDESDDEDMEDNPQPLSHVIKAKTKTKDDEKSRPKTSNEDDDVTAGPSGRSVRQSTKDQTAKTTKSTKVKTTKYARTPDLGTRFPLSESRAPPTNNAAHEIHHIYTALTANDDGPWTPGMLQLLPFYHYNIDSIRQLLSGPLGRASPGNEDLLYAFIPRLHTIARASAPYNNDIEITNLTIAPPKLFRRPAAHRPRASLAPQQTGFRHRNPVDVEVIYEPTPWKDSLTRSRAPTIIGGKARRSIEVEGFGYSSKGQVRELRSLANRGQTSLPPEHHPVHVVASRSLSQRILVSKSKTFELLEVPGFPNITVTLSTVNGTRSVIPHANLCIASRSDHVTQNTMRITAMAGIPIEPIQKLNFKDAVVLPFKGSLCKIFNVKCNPQGTGVSCLHCNKKIPGYCDHMLNAKHLASLAQPY